MQFTVSHTTATVLVTPHSAFVPELTVRVLHTPEQRQEIVHLRQYAAYHSEYELDPGMASLESIKDALGVVMAFSLNDEVIATIRFIPTGHGVTLTERYWSELVTDSAILGTTSWEVGRLVMAPEHRHADLLPRCMAMAFMELLNWKEVEHFHASCLLSMTRLYRRFGFDIHARRTHGQINCALIHGRVDDIARRLKVSIRSDDVLGTPLVQ